MKARIFKPSRTAMQSGRAKTDKWVLEYERYTAKPPEALMGWVSAGDTADQVRLKFPSAEAAQAYAEKKGLEYTITPEHSLSIKPKNYADNFKYREPEE